MKIIKKYIAFEVLRYFGIIQLIVNLIFILYDFLGTSAAFMEKNIPLIVGFYYVLLRIPQAVIIVTPICSILSVVIVYGLMNRNNEMVVLQSSGITVNYINKVAYFAGLLFTVFYFINTEIITPITVVKANKIFQWARNGRNYEKNYNWIKSGNDIIHIKYYNSDTKTISGLTVYSLDKKFNLTKRIDAKICVYQDNGTWKLSNLIEQKQINNTGVLSEKYIDEKKENLKIFPEDLKYIVKQNIEMTFIDIYKTMKKMEKEGYDANLLKVELHSRIAVPFTCFVMCFLGTIIATRGRTKGNIPLSIVSGIIITLFFWTFHSFFLSVGKGEMLPPFVAAWITNFVFLLIGIYFLKKPDAINFTRM